MTWKPRRAAVLTALLFFLFLFVLATDGTDAAVAPHEPSRFDPLVVHDPVSRLGVLGESPDALPGFDAERAGWRTFAATHGGRWTVHIDRRSGTPMLVQGSGIRWAPVGDNVALDDLETLARQFVAANAALFKVRESQLVLNREGSGPMDADHWILTFDRVVDGVPVEGQRFVLYVTRGNLSAFGAGRWGPLETAPSASISADEARTALYGHMGIEPHETVEELESGTPVLLAVAPEGIEEGRYTGPVGAGIDYRLAYRFALRVAGERGTWVGKVDARSGDILSLYDDDKYAQVKGGVYPVSNDGDCADLGCEVAGYPMPYADVDSDTANDMGMFDCASGTVTTNLAGPYVLISDNCGAVSESVTCDDDLDLGTSTGDDCTVPAGGSAGNTHSSRTCFYHVNRIKEKGRYWLPSNSWLPGSLTTNVNINSTCNAFWNGTINFYRSGGGCGNTGEIGGVIHHEYGHGIDQNDGGGYDNPSEAYADVIAIIQEHRSCVGRGFFDSGTCGGYGDTCLSCTGIRDMDWDARTSHTPATPENFTGPRCGGGGGPCGRAVHCESYVPSETIFDLATRDLPASGMDPDSAWQLAEKLFYASRQGSGGDSFNCSLPDSDGCTVDSWFTKLRNADDDDGNLANGTPHAAAIFAAFDRHAIACGAASDPDNQDSSSCPTLDQPILGATAGSNSANLSWTEVPGAANYLILRNDVDCDYTSNVIATVAAPSTTYTDADLPNDFPLNYRVQAQGSNTACESAVSTCETTTPQPFAGSIKLDKSVYACTGTVTITVRDANIGSSTTTADLFSASEPTPETVVLTETSPGSAKYIGTILTTDGPSTNGDGTVQVSHGELLTAHYIDADDNEGGTNLLRETTASIDCVFPVISAVTSTGITNVRADIDWTTDELSNSVVRWGEITPPSNTTSESAMVSSHSVRLTGLQECTVYFYSVESVDVAANVAVDDNSGAYYQFETLGDLGNGIQSCHAGLLTISDAEVSCADTLPIQVTDIDLNLSATLVDTVEVEVTSTTEATPEFVTLTETGPNTSKFSGSIATALGDEVTGDGILQMHDGDVLTATYHDEDDGNGVTAVSFDTSSADCAPPGVTSLRVINLTDFSVQVQWTTSEPTTGQVQWGPTPALGNTANDNVFRTTHTLTLQTLDECGSYHFRVSSTDAFGQTTIVDAEGSPFSFHAWEIPGAVFKDGFETDLGWTLQGVWEIGTPQGLGTSPGDGTAAFSGASVLGHDLSGQGAHPGDYEPNTNESATSPVLDLSALSNTEIKFRRRLNVGAGGEAQITVRAGSTILPPVWTSTNTTQSGFSLQTVNIANRADGEPEVRIIFKQKGGSGPGTRAGWNIDRFIVRSANNPDFAACGSCAGAPSFAGIVSAVDADPCGDTGIQLSWNVAPAWGSGQQGSYSVYRDTVPGFTPSGANLVAAGIPGTGYLDSSAPNDVALYYVVRAENNETCSDGPANGGVTDTNLVYASSSDETSQTLPGGLGDSLRVGILNDAHLRLDWSAVPDAATYHVYRSASAQGPFSLVADTAGTFHDDLGEFGTADSWYYLVKAADACGNEGP